MSCSIFGYSTISVICLFCHQQCHSNMFHFCLNSHTLSGDVCVQLNIDTAFDIFIVMMDDLFTKFFSVSMQPWLEKRRRKYTHGDRETWSLSVECYSHVFQTRCVYVLVNKYFTHRFLRLTPLFLFTPENTHSRRQTYSILLTFLIEIDQFQWRNKKNRLLSQF